jgi:tRNA G10  N-methylase Trm11
MVLGREPKISLAELEAIFSSSKVKQIAPQLALVTARSIPFDRIGGSIKAAQLIDQPIQDYLSNLPAGKITLGISDYSEHTNPHKTWELALKYKNMLKRHGRNVRLIPNNDGPVLSSAASHHNQLGEKLNHIEILKFNNHLAVSIGTQNITAYAKRDRERPARDAFVGMLPPKLAQILINIAVGEFKKENQDQKDLVVLDPFCGTGVVLQEATLMGYSAYGTDLSEKMISYSKKNMDWLTNRTPELQEKDAPKLYLEPGDATDHSWNLAKVNCIASEIYLGHPLSQAPSGIKLKEYQQSTKALLTSFLKNIGAQIASGTTLCLATPAWLRPNGHYEGVNILDEIEKLGYNTLQYKHAASKDLLYYREGQIVARKLLILRKQ